MTARSTSPTPTPTDGRRARRRRRVRRAARPAPTARKGYSAHVIEAGDGVGGTWYWNRYPGARVDIESLEYSYAFAEELQQEWGWPERYSEQPDVLRYLEWVADRLDLRRDIQLRTAGSESLRVRRDERDLDGDDRAAASSCAARYVRAAVGFLSSDARPHIPGLDTFAGQLVHTGAWPQAGIDLSGKRVAIIGAGATSVQLIPQIAAAAEHADRVPAQPEVVLPDAEHADAGGLRGAVKSMYPELRRREHDESCAGAVLVGFQVRLRRRPRSST